MEHAHDGCFVEPHDATFGDGRGCRQAPWLAGQTALAKEIPLRMDCDDRFLPMLGNNADFDLAFLNVKDRIRRIPLQEDTFILSIRRYGPTRIHRGEKRCDIEGRLAFCFHDNSSRLSRPKSAS